MPGAWPVQVESFLRNDLVDALTLVRLDLISDERTVERFRAYRLAFLLTSREVVFVVGSLAARFDLGEIVRDRRTATVS